MAFSIGALWNFPVLLCAGRDGAEGSHANTCTHRAELPRPLLLRSCHQLPTSGASCQGCSVARQRPHAAFDNAVIVRVMGCVIRQPPIQSIKEWHRLIPAWVLQPSPKGCLAQPRVLPAPWEQGAAPPASGLLSHSSDFSLQFIYPLPVQ